MTTWQEARDNPATLELWFLRAKIFRLTRDFFMARDFLEVDTPIANATPGQEPYLDPVDFCLTDPAGRIKKVYLQTSPEYAMKKMLAAGMERIFQLSHCFRDGEAWGGRHYPEFVMLEWYRRDAEYAMIMEDTEELIKFLARGLQRDVLTGQNGPVDLQKKWERKTMREVWQEYAGVDLRDYLTVDRMRELARGRGYNVAENERYEDLFYRIFLTEIEPRLGEKTPVFIYEYPAELGALARFCPENKNFAERFELYIGGIELANAFGELTDATEQKRRFLAEQKIRADLGKEALPVDGDFLEALNSLAEHNYAPSGIALGLDRLVMLFAGALDIRQVLLLSPDADC